MNLYCPQCRATYDDSVSVCPEDGTRLRADECPDAGEFAALLDNSLSAEQERELHAHLDRCPACTELVIELGLQHAGSATEPQCIGRYQIRREIGAGNMGVVYECYDPELGRTVAVKVLHVDHHSDDHSERTARMRREARLLASLSHPNIVAIYDVGTWRGQIFLTLEYVDGHSLRRWRTEHQADWREIVEIFMDAGRGIAAAHAAHIIHRDIKPDNILISEQGRVLVADFGLARAMDRPHTGPQAQVSSTWDSLTQSNTIVGTPAFMAPEQYRGDEVDERADIFSFCAALYRVVYQATPFEGRSVSQLASNVCSGAVLPPPSGDAPAGLFEILRAGLAADPERRPASMDELLSSLDALLEQERRPAKPLVRRPLYCPACNTTYEASVEVCPNDGTRLYQLEPGDDPLVGVVLDERFRVDELIGQGGMGAVYRGAQLSVDRQVAIKVLRAEFVDRQVALERFFREAKLISAMTHPNIVRLIEFGQDRERDLLYLVMELVEGTDLSALLGRGRLKANLAVEIAYQVLGALTEPHAAHIIHRDLKPDNLLLSARSDGTLQVKVLDFGIARALQRNTRLTQTGMICGTPAYMAPEQSRDKPVDARTDLYALGVILYEMLAGQPPFMGQSSLQIMLKHIQEDPPALRDVLPPGALPEALEDLVYDLMAKDPARRPATARQVRDRIDHLRAELGLAPVRLDEELPPQTGAGDATVAFASYILPAMPISDELERGNTRGLVKETDLFVRTVAEDGPTSVDSAEMLDDLGADEDAPDTEHDRVPPTTPMRAPGFADAEQRTRVRAGAAASHGDPPSVRTVLPGGQTEEVEASTEFPAQARPATQTRPGAGAGVSTRALVAIALGTGVAIVVVAGLLFLVLAHQRQTKTSPASPAPAQSTSHPAHINAKATIAVEAPAVPAAAADTQADPPKNPAAANPAEPASLKHAGHAPAKSTSIGSSDAASKPAAPTHRAAKKSAQISAKTSAKPPRPDASADAHKDKPTSPPPAPNTATSAKKPSPKEPDLGEEFQDLMNAE